MVEINIVLSIGLISSLLIFAIPLFKITKNIMWPIVLLISIIWLYSLNWIFTDKITMHTKPVILFILIVAFGVLGLSFATYKHYRTQAQ
ncbi:hypothetical protein BTS2_0446 [Bacillus sp. TS-2]|nr:hypothetical protein BTS2_0446 [Bacillus sp. TS-2]